MKFKFPTFKKVIGFMHLWLGLTSGLVVFIVALTGAMYVFSEDINELLERDIRTVTPQSTPKLRPSELLAIAKPKIDSLYGVKPKSYWGWEAMVYKNTDNRAVNISGHRYENPESYYSIYIDPYNGKVLEAKDIAGSNFWSIVLDLHLNLMMGEFGNYLVDYGTLIFLIMVISGIILWWPKNKSAAKQRFWFRWSTSIKWKRKNYDLHNILGFYACWVVIFMAITGLMWSFEWFDKSVYFILDGKVMEEQASTAGFANINTDSKSIDKVVDQLVKIAPKSKAFDIFLAGDSNYHEARVFLTDNWGENDVYRFSPVDGKLISKELYADLSTGAKFRNLSGDIHYGWIYGWPSKIATFFACLIAASLPISGFYIWWGRRNKKKH